MRASSLFSQALLLLRVASDRAVKVFGGTINPRSLFRSNARTISSTSSGDFSNELRS